MKSRGSESPKLPNVVDITNQSDTFNYYAIGSDRKLYLINPSNSPISVTTQAFDLILFQTPIPIHRADWFEIKSKGDYHS